MKSNFLHTVRKQWLVIILGILGFFIFLLAIAYGLFQISKSRSFQFFGDIIPRVETDEKIVALTFDDAPTSYSDEVLKILAEKNIKTTFYVIGQNVEKHPQEAKNIVEAGHELGNHSYTHQRMWVKSLSFVEMEVEKTNQLIKETGYQGEITFRPPYSKKMFALPWYLSQHNIKTIMVDVEPETYLPKLDNDDQKTEWLINHTLEKTQPGSIILLHPFCSSCGASREAIAPIIDGLHEKGYEFVTVSELLKK